MAQAAVVVDVLEKLLVFFCFFLKKIICHFLRHQGMIHLVTIQRQLQRYQIEQSPRDL